MRCLLNQRVVCRIVFNFVSSNLSACLTGTVMGSSAGSFLTNIVSEYR